MRDTSLNIRHILKDGTVLKDISGYKVPSDHPVYEVVSRLKEREVKK